MPIIQTANSKAKVKQSTSQDIPFTSSSPVMAKYGPVDSTAGQTTISLTFSVDTLNSSIFFLSINGQILSEGKDFTFSNLNADSTSSTIALKYPLAAGQSIQAWKLGLKKESEFQTDNRFVSLYAAQVAGFLPFVDPAPQLVATTATGSPAAGTFHSSVIGRAPINDITQDLKASLGIERTQFQQIALVHSEFGPNAEAVYALANDERGLIRFVGTWSNIQNSNGNSPGPATAADTSTYLEVTFYGTGLNVLLFVDANNRDARVSVDGGAEGANIIPSTLNGVLSGRGYDGNTIIPVASGLSLGVHTVKIRNNSAFGMYVFGIETVNQSTAINLNPGVGYSSGQKLTLAAAQSLSYNSTFESGTLGSRGGRVVVYQKLDGTIAKAVTPTNASQQNLTNADHTNEEVSRIYTIREFGSNQSTDFQSTTGSSTKQFTLEDGTTTFLGSAAFNSIFGGREGYGFSVGSYYTFTFVGTGCDMAITIGAGEAATYQLSVDGTSIGNLSYSAPASGQRLFSYKIVSGLPYGTHVVRIANTAGTPTAIAVNYLKSYQPKKPTIPTGAMELADYNVMATFAANTTAGVDTISTGVLRKVCTREMVYSDNGTIQLVVGAPASDVAAQAVVVGGAGAASNSYLQYTFFGTGFDFRGFAAGAWSNSIQVSLNGSNLNTANYATLTGGGSLASNSSVYGLYSFTAATGILSQAGGTGGGNGFRVSGLPLGLYTLKLQTTTAAAFGINTIDVITPIHSARSTLSLSLQNALPIGSCAISDNRRYSPIANATTKKNVSQAIGITSGPTTTSVSLVPMPEMSVGHYNTSGKIRVNFLGNLANSLLGNYADVAIFIDGQQASHQILGPTTGVAGQVNNVNVSGVFTVTPGFHHVQIYWVVGGGTGTANSTQRILTVEEA